MYANQLKLGLVCWTAVGPKHVQVKVVADSGLGQERFVCQRVDTGENLPKPRSAAKLHPSDGQWARGRQKQQGLPAVTRVSGVVRRATVIPGAPDKLIAVPVVKAKNLSTLLMLQKLTQLPEAERQAFSDLLDSVLPSVVRHTA